MKLCEFKKLTPEERENALYLMSPISCKSKEEFNQCLRWHVFYKIIEILEDFEIDERN
jgi:hypothetical protein